MGTPKISGYRIGVGVLTVQTEVSEAGVFFL